MGLFGRAWARIREWFSEPESPPSQPTSGGFSGGFDDGFTSDISGTPEPDLPPGWSFEGLYTDGERTINHDPSDREIANADAIIVGYTDALGRTYRVVHGANSRKGVGKLISQTIVVVSPPR